jgi:biopolymer transport protein ExbB/TolQ
LNTTILGLAIAIPALVAHAYFLRRVEFLAARIGMAVQALIESKPRG